MNLKRIKDMLRGEPNIESLKAKGLEVGSNFSYGHYCFFDPSHCFLISIGNNVTFSTRVHLLAHDASTKNHIGYSKVGRVIIEDDVFIVANVTILPGVTVGKNSIVGAGSVVTKSVDANSVYAGVPAKRICSLEQYLEKAKLIDERVTFEEDFTFRGGITEAKKQYMKEMLSDGKIGLVR